MAAIRRIRAAERNPKLEGYLWQGKQYEGLVVNALEGLWAAGTRVLGDDGRVFPEPERAEVALRFLRGLIAEGLSPPWTTAADEEITRRAFGQGRGDLPPLLALCRGPLRAARFAGAGQGGSWRRCHAMPPAARGQAPPAARTLP